jgi:hypothetical protein
VSLSAVGLVQWSAPGLAWIGATAAALVLARKSRRALVVVAAVAAAILLPPWIVRDRTLALARMTWGYIVDVSNLDLRMTHVEYPFFGPAPDGLGNMHIGEDETLANGTALKALLQSSPILALAAIAGYGRTGTRARALLCLLPAVGLVASLATSARFEGGAAFGWPYLFPRYVTPAVPMLAVLAVGAVRELPWRTLDLVPAAVVAIAGLACFLPHLTDAALVLRVLELRVTLLVAAAAVVTAAVARRRPGWARAACVAGSVALGAGVAVSVGVDARRMAHRLDVRDERVRRFAELTPERFAVIGWAPQTDPILSLRASRDVEYVDFTEIAGDWAGVRRVLDRWAADDRPVYGAFPPKVYDLPYPPAEVPIQILDAKESFLRVGPPTVPAAPR